MSDVEQQQHRIIEDFRSRIWKQGYLTKEGRRIKSWKRRFFVLRNGQLEYYTNEQKQESNLRGHIVLQKCSVRFLGSMDLAGGNSMSSTAMVGANSPVVASNNYYHDFEDDDSDYDDTNTMMDTNTFTTDHHQQHHSHNHNHHHHNQSNQSRGHSSGGGSGSRKTELSSYVHKFVVYDEQRALHMAAKSAQEARAWVQVITNCINVENYYATCTNFNDTRPLLPVILLLSKGNELSNAAANAAMMLSASSGDGTSMIPVVQQQPLQVSSNYEIITSHVDATKLELEDIQPFTIHTLRSVADSVLYNKSLSMLNTLKISGCAMNDDFITLLSEAMSINRNITSLDLSNNRIGDKGCGLLCDGLLINTVLEHLDMSGNEFGNAGVVHISDLLLSNISLLTLNLSRNKISKDGILALSKALIGNTTLTQLNLSHSMIDEEAAEHLSKGLKGNKSLLSLGLAHCSINSNGMDSLCYGVLVNKTLRDLDLRGNVFDKEGGFALITALKDHKSLTRVDVGDNKSLGVDGITVLAQALKSRFLISKLVMTRSKK